MASSTRPLSHSRSTTSDSMNGPTSSRWTMASFGVEPGSTRSASASISACSRLNSSHP